MSSETRKRHTFTVACIPQVTTDRSYTTHLKVESDADIRQFETDWEVALEEVKEEQPGDWQFDDILARLCLTPERNYTISFPGGPDIEVAY